MKLDSLLFEFTDRIKKIAIFHARETGYSPEMIEWGFDHMFSHWSSAELVSFLCTEIPGMTENRAQQLLDAELTVEERKKLVGRDVFERVLMVTASTVPSAAFQDALLLLLLPCNIVVRPAGTLAPMFNEFLAVVSHFMPEFGKRLGLSSSDHDEDRIREVIRGRDAVCINGSDAVVDHYKSLIEESSGGAETKLIPHGHRVSAMILKHGEMDNLSSDEIRRMAVDISVWDQMGCLSPKSLFVEENSEDIKIFAEKMIISLDKIGAQLPESPPEMSDLAKKNSTVRMMLLDGVQIFRGTVNHDILAVYVDSGAFSPVLMPRFLNIYPVRDAVSAACRFSPKGQALGSRRALGPDSLETLAAAGYNYFCRFGSMQDPPLSWFHDGIGTLRPFIK